MLKVEKKSDGWYVGGERHATQAEATRRLIALLMAPARAAPKPSRVAAPRVVAPPPPKPSRAAAPRTVALPPPPPPRSSRGSGVVGPFPGEVMLAKPYKDSDPTGWWMSEKLDGMRAYWTGSGLFSRNGKPVYAPKWFTSALPKMALDGELMTGRGQFQKTISIVRKQTPVDAEWRQIRYFVFDAPMQPGSCESRWTQMAEAVESVPFVEVVEQIACASPKHLAKMRSQIAALGGEGVMLRQAQSVYEHRRTSALQKVKSFMDTEAKITGYVPGEGKHAGRLGAYEAKLLSGSKARFRIGTGMSDAERDDPLPVGTVITVKFQEYTDDGVPRFPSLIGARDYE